MFGLIGKISTTPGHRDEVIALMRSGTGSMPGCHAYLIAADADNPDAIWVTEVWETEEHHQASLQIPEVRAVIQQAMPFITGVESIATTRPVLD